MEEIKRVAAHAGLVHKVAGAIHRRVPASVAYDDLVQDGMIGLLHAARKFADDGGAQFESYAATRIYGAIIDGLRGSDPRSRHLGRAMRRVDEAHTALEQELGRQPSESEVAARVGFRLGEYQALLRDVAAHRVVSYDDQFEWEHEDPGADLFASGALGPAERVEQREREQAVIEAFSALSERERNVMDLYYDNGLMFQDIAQRLGVSTGRVSQLHTECLRKLREQFARTYG